MLGVITDDSREKTVYSSFRMLFAYAGSFISLAAWEPMCDFFGSVAHANLQHSWQYSMMVIATACLVLFLLCFKLTREQVTTRSTVSIGSDFRSLMRTSPWWLMIGAALCSFRGET